MNDERNPLDVIEAKHALVYLADLTATYFRALIEEGMSEVAALHLTIAWVHTARSED